MENIFDLIKRLEQEAIERETLNFKDDPDSLEMALSFIHKSAKHSADIHHMLDGIINLGGLDAEALEKRQYPHDLAGPGNKFDSQILKDLMKDKIFKGKEKSLQIHRLQLHHQVEILPSTLAEKDDIEIWGTDKILAIAEKRNYKKEWTWKDIDQHIKETNSLYDKTKQKALQRARKRVYNYISSNKKE